MASAQPGGVGNAPAFGDLPPACPQAAIHFAVGAFQAKAAGFKLGIGDDLPGQVAVFLGQPFPHQLHMVRVGDDLVVAVENR